MIEHVHVYTVSRYADDRCKPPAYMQNHMHLSEQQRHNDSLYNCMRHWHVLLLYNRALILLKSIPGGDGQKHHGRRTSTSRALTRAEVLRIQCVIIV